MQINSGISTNFERVWQNACDAYPFSKLKNLLSEM